MGYVPPPPEWHREAHAKWERWMRYQFIVQLIGIVIGVAGLVAVLIMMEMNRLKEITQ